MSSKNIELSNELFEYLGRFYPVFAVAPGDVKDRNAFCFGLNGTVFTAILGKDFMDKIRIDKREIEFKVDFLDKVHNFGKKNES